MNQLTSLAIQLSIIIPPIAVFALLRRRLSGARARVICAVTLALLFAAIAFFVAAKYGWRPMGRSGRLVPLGPLALSAINFGAILLALLSMSVSKPKKAA